MINSLCPLLLEYCNRIGWEHFNRKAPKLMVKTLVATIQIFPSNPLKYCSPVIRWIGPLGSRWGSIELVYGMLNSISINLHQSLKFELKKQTKTWLSLIHFFWGSDRRRHRGMFFPGVWDVAYYRWPIPFWQLQSGSTVVGYEASMLCCKGQ